MDVQLHQMKSTVNVILVLILVSSLFGLFVLGAYVPIRTSLALEKNLVDTNRLIHSGVLNPNAVNDEKIKAVVVSEMEAYSRPLVSAIHESCLIGGAAFLVSAVISVVAIIVSILPARRLS